MPPTSMGSPKAVPAELPAMVSCQQTCTDLPGEVGQPLFRSHDKIPRRIRFSICPLDALVWADAETVDRQTDSQEIGSYRLSQQI